MKRFEIWATFENGMTESAELAVDAMNFKNRNDVAQGYGFPYGVPTYSIKTIVK